jgi:DMSO/TMAO reductase YedYZ molybdopterin-dependent catalytic subunit
VSDFTEYEVASALRNREMPLEALTREITPTGMHYLLAHFDIPFVDIDGWRLTIDGDVERPVSLDIEELRARDRTELAVTLECAGNGRALMSPRHQGQPWHLGGVSTAMWGGTALGPLLEEAGVAPGAVEVVFTGLDRGIEDGAMQSYRFAVPLAEALRPEVLLADEMNGRPLEPQHGFPLRVVLPGWYGMAHVKWLTAITVVSRPFLGPQVLAYRLVQGEDDEGAGLDRIAPRSLLAPPGIADEDDGIRVAPSGPLELRGRAWSGFAPIEHVEVSIDGEPWRDATLEPAPSTFSWAGWRLRVDLSTRGELEVRSRASDALGNTQPDEPRWNLWGYANNAVQGTRIRVVDRAELEI